MMISLKCPVCSSSIVMRGVPVVEGNGVKIEFDCVECNCITNMHVVSYPQMTAHLYFSKLNTSPVEGAEVFRND